MAVVLFVGGCEESQDVDSRTAAEKCTDYCTVIEQCDSVQFYALFPSVQQCIANCTDTLTGGVAISPECLDATEGVIACIGRISCDEYAGYPCPAQAAQQDQACSDP